MRRIAAVAFLSAAVLVSSAASGLAALPTFKTTTVRVPKSIAGVSLGMPKAKANKQWGGKGACSIIEVTPVCQYVSKKSPESGRAVFGLDPDGNVSIIIVSGMPNPKNPGETVPLTKGPLLQLETKEGLAFGDRFSKFKKLYPDVQPQGDTYAIDGPGSQMLFQFSQDQQPRLIGMGLFKIV